MSVSSPRLSLLLSKNIFNLVNWITRAIRFEQNIYLGDKVVSQWIFIQLWKCNLGFNIQRREKSLHSFIAALLIIFIHCCIINYIHCLLRANRRPLICSLCRQALLISMELLFGGIVNEKITQRRGWLLSNGVKLK